MADLQFPELASINHRHYARWHVEGRKRGHRLPGRLRLARLRLFLALAELVP